jgi:hypothetical protein
MRHYQGRCIEILDGDTLLCWIDLGFYVWTMAAVRLTGLDVPQDPTPFDLKREEKAKLWLEQRLANSEILDIHTKVDDETGIITADIIDADTSVNLQMQKLGLCRGQKRLGVVH